MYVVFPLQLKLVKLIRLEFQCCESRFHLVSFTQAVTSGRYLFTICDLSVDLAEFGISSSCLKCIFLANSNLIYTFSVHLTKQIFVPMPLPRFLGMGGLIQTRKREGSF